MQVLLQIIETEGKHELRIPMDTMLTRSQIDAIREAVEPILKQ